MLVRPDSLVVVVGDLTNWRKFRQFPLFQLVYRDFERQTKPTESIWSRKDEPTDEEMNVIIKSGHHNNENNCGSYARHFFAMN